MKKRFEKDQKSMSRSRLFGACNAKKEVKPLLEQDAFTLLKSLHYGDVSSELKLYEDEHLGNFSRIFPPENEDLLNSYLQLLVYLESIFSSGKNETIATKARKEYLDSKKSLQDLKTLKYQEWKKRRLLSSKTESKPRAFSLDSILQNKQSISDTSSRSRLSVTSAQRTQRSEIELRVQNITYPSGS